MKFIPLMALTLVASLLGLGSAVAGRYYDARTARWASPYPLADKQRAWTPYHYSNCNPLRCVDPTGLVPGEYKDVRGNSLGNDNINDKKVYVTDKRTVNQNTKDGKTDWTAVQNDNGTALLPTVRLEPIWNKSSPDESKPILY